MTTRIQLLFLLALMSVVPALCQEATGLVVYDFKLAGKLKEGELLFTSKAQKFIFDKLEGKKGSKKKVDVENLTFDLTKRDKFGSVVYSNWDADIYKKRQIGNTIYIIEDSVLNHNWKITSENKEILGFNCQKATLTFRGRKYEAWFAPDIPVAAGPWKFHGLPGLILEVVDNARQVVFYSREVIFPYNINAKEIEEFDYKGEAIGWLDYEIMNLEKSKKLAGFLASKAYADDEDNSDVRIEVEIPRAEILPEKILEEYSKDN
ncbi:GLPGLI family protein [Ekhidna sp.]|uniref:GLPGLI family protein n=1 Tax=Ekhidna sp. TaxID=2608089 RepID=UPI0032EB6D14